MKAFRHDRRWAERHRYKEFLDWVSHLPYYYELAEIVTQIEDIASSEVRSAK